ncbi:protoporphyrinogen oxidase [Lactococcus nasutitermitis]|uniref:Coproporphyrinogen III oxidase n=1 Tax=Lactococcus nasutitermitis TaxID=1652957 RepID=A0ABV9JDB3_9LACT|nr:protoporphyrinogen oxidase [Lactococcus nasutitermitis]
MKHIAIIGGGITGLTAAFYLQKTIEEQKLDIDWKLFEADKRLGGKIETVHRDGYIIERGADSWLARKSSMVDLAKELGIDDRLVHNATGKAYILLNDKLHPIPAGSIMGIPTNKESFDLSELVSEAGKKRAYEDLIIGKSPANTDQSMGQFFRRRLGDEVVENLIEPLLSGVYGGELDTMSLLSTYPQFYEVEQKYGNLIDGMRLQNEMNKKNTPYTGGKQGMFYNFNTGLETVVDKIKERLPYSQIFENTTIEHIEKIGNQYELTLENGDKEIFDSVIVTTPHYTMQKMLSQYDFLDEFKTIPATSVVTVALAFDRSSLPQDIDGTGFLVSRNAHYSITACTWVHKKWAHSTPEGKIVLRCFMGKPGDERYVNLSDDEIVDLALTDLRKIMDLQGEPEFAEISRLANSMPQYTVGHKERLVKVYNELEKETPGLFIAGMSYTGVGLPDNVTAGKLTEEKALDYLNKK